ncbi:hypothetical protein PR003_g4614 [Phytophthora rubi]|uniref:Uncharacterized protein n=1 Tax=Phytophthora rubi TaxID=129364 RepID=A0A6A4G4S9_9STRA|nr:hypothetical protein PR003_g4614 [Phytophthora rubi]
MLMKSTPDLSDIVGFGSPCTVHRHAKNKPLGERGKPAMIIGKSDDMKGYRVYPPPKTRWWTSLSTSGTWKLFTDEQNEQLRGVTSRTRRRRKRKKSTQMLEEQQRRSPSVEQKVAGPERSTRQDQFLGKQLRLRRRRTPTTSTTSQPPTL